MAQPDCFDRQRLLPEVGAAGQKALEATHLDIGPGISPGAADAAELYGRALGFGSVGRSETLSNPSFPHQDVFQHGAARDVAHGAHLVLRRALGVLGLPLTTDS